MIYFRGGIDKLPGYLQTIISWYAFGLVYMIFYISNRSNTGSLKRQTFCGNPKKLIKRKLIALCTHGGNQSTGRLWHRSQRTNHEFLSYGELLQNDEQIELEFAFVDRRASELELG